MLPANCRAATGTTSSNSRAMILQIEHHPFGGAEPVQIRLGLYITDLAMVDEASENFEIQGYIYASRKDDRLIDKTALRPDKPRNLDPRRFGTRNLISRMYGPSKVSATITSAFLTGRSTGGERFDAVLSAEYFPRRFPFDHQSLFVLVQPAISPARPNHSLVEFAPTDYATGLGPDTYLAAWDIEAICYSRRVEHRNNLGLDVPRAEFEMMVKRRSGFYVWKVFLPILLMTMVSWTTFWVKADEFDWQMKIPLTRC